MQPNSDGRQFSSFHTRW